MAKARPSYSANSAKRPAIAGEPLTPREVQVAELLLEGLSNKLIGDRTGMTAHTAKFHVCHVIKKLGGTNRTHAALLYQAFKEQTMPKSTVSTKTFTIELSKDELTILQYALPRDNDGDPLKDTYELGDDKPEDPYAALATLSMKVNKLQW